MLYKRPYRGLKTDKTIAEIISPNLDLPSDQNQGRFPGRNAFKWTHEIKHEFARLLKGLQA
jgi:hypothetical protein